MTLEQDNNIYPVDSSASQDQIWLVKIPNHIFNEWMKSPENSSIAKIVIDNNKENQENQFKLICNPSFIHNEDIGLMNKFVINSTCKNKDKNLSVGAREDKSFVMKTSNSNVNYKSNKNLCVKKKSLIGRINVRAHVVPEKIDGYFARKAKNIKLSNVPLRTIKLLSTQSNIKQYSKKEKEMKTKFHKPEPMRRDALMNLICSLFEQHQYYYLKSIVDLTKQTPSAVKSILDEIGQISKDSSHRRMWELKPEFRHYK